MIKTFIVSYFGEHPNSLRDFCMCYGVKINRQIDCIGNISVQRETSLKTSFYLFHMLTSPNINSNCHNYLIDLD